VSGASDLLDFESGRRFGRYTIVKRLSVGGMAEVFLALARGPGEFRKVVTLKRILPQYRGDPEFVALFLEEARISASLSHANIAQVFDLGNVSGELFLAMEFVPGEDLQQILNTEIKRNQRPPIGLSTMVLRDALLALHHAHTFVDATGAESPIVHRDASLRNVMVAYDGTIKVIDFGIAKAMGPMVIGSGSLRGSSGYMSPEQLSGAPLDARSDVFTIGVLLHEMLAARRLFSTKGKDGIAEMTPTAVMPLHEIDAEISPELSDVVARALAFDFRARWQTAREMARALELATQGLMWNQEQAAAYMQELFHDNLERIRAVVQIAARTGATHESVLSRFEEPTAVDRPALRDGDTTAVLGSRSPRKLEISERPVVVAVDDSAVALQLLKYQMSKHDIDVVCCSTPSEALEAIRSSTPDALLLDVVMPELDGFELCKLIRELPNAHHVPILFLSAACDLDERTRCLDAGGDDFIKKPYVAADLASRLRSHFGRAATIAPLD
jgi:serine/threonine protein kinase/ActR/RegA family two-component response regulator